MRQSTTRTLVGSARRSDPRALRLGLVGGLISGLFRTPRPEVAGEDLQRHDYPTSTQHVGVRFTERVRNVFRLRWIREIF